MARKRAHLEDRVADMRLIADLHISPSTVRSLRAAGHDVVRVTDVMPATSPDHDILVFAREQQRVVLTQDLDFSRLVATRGDSTPSVISLRLSSSRVEHVNAVLTRVLPTLDELTHEHAIVTIEDHRIRRRNLPVQ